MPTYSYICDNCDHEFEMFFHISNYIEHPKCEQCKKKKTRRSYVKDVSSQHMAVKKNDSELKTMGDLANRNRDRMTEEQKVELYKKHNSYKEEQSTKELPKGMSRMKKPKFKTKWTQ
jgi:putative FmdB family regulatory protein